MTMERNLDVFLINIIQIIEEIRILKQNGYFFYLLVLFICNLLQIQNNADMYGLKFLISHKSDIMHEHDCF